MRTKYHCIAAILIILSLLVACATFGKNAYKTLDTARITYTQTMSALGDLQRQGKLNDADVQKIIKAGRVYYQAYQVALKAYEVYCANPTIQNKDQLVKFLEDVSIKLAELTAILFQYQGGAK